MSTRTEFPDFRNNVGKFLKVNSTETDVLWDFIDLATDVEGVLQIANGGTGADNAEDALNNLLPDQTGHEDEVLHTDGTTPYWGPSGGAGGIDTRVYSTGSTSVGFNPALGFRYAGLSGIIGSTNEAAIQTSFGENVVVKKIIVQLSTGTIDDDVILTLRKNGVDTSTVMTIPALSATEVVSFDVNESYAASDLYSIRIESSGTGSLAFQNFETLVQVSTGDPLGVQSVSGNGVDNTDPFNPVIPTADTNTEGTLSAADWDIFNGKQDPITTGTLSSSTSGVTVGTGTNRLIGGNATINISTASGSQQGLLSAADWTTFNSKQDALPTLCVVKAYQSALNSGGIPFVANTEVSDTTASYDTATGIFTAPRTGYYLVTGSFSVEGHSADPSIVSAQIIKNGSLGVDSDSVRYDGTEGAADFWKRRLKVVSTVQLTAGDTIEFNVSVNTGTISVTGGVEGNQITITELR